MPGTGFFLHDFVHDSSPEFIQFFLKCFLRTDWIMGFQPFDQAAMDKANEPGRVSVRLTLTI